MPRLPCWSLLFCCMDCLQWLTCVCTSVACFLTRSPYFDHSPCSMRLEAKLIAWSRSSCTRRLTVNCTGRIGLPHKMLEMHLCCSSVAQRNLATLFMMMPSIPVSCIYIGHGLWAVQAELSESNLGVQQPPPQEDVCHCALWPWAVGWTDVSSHTHLPFSLHVSVH